MVKCLNLENEMTEKSPRRFHKRVMYFVQQQEDRHGQYGGFSSGLSKEFQKQQRQGESSSAELYVLQKDHSSSCQQTSFVVHKQST